MSGGRGPHPAPDPHLGRCSCRALQGTRRRGRARQGGRRSRGSATSGFRCSSASGPCRGVTKPHTGLFLRSTSERRDSGQGVPGFFTSHPKGTGPPGLHYEFLLGFGCLDKCHLLQKAFLPALAHPELPLLWDPVKGTSHASFAFLGSPVGVQG